MSETVQAQSTSSEEEVRQAIGAALTAQGGQIERNEPGALVVDVGGTVGTAFLAGPFRNAMKMPMRVNVTTSGGPGGTGIAVEVESHGTGGGYMSGGIFGVMKSRKASRAWIQTVLNAIPNQVQAGPAAPGQFTA